MSDPHMDTAVVVQDAGMITMHRGGRDTLCLADSPPRCSRRY